MHTGWTQSAATSPPALAKRPYRHYLCTLAYVRIDHANGGIIRNLNDTGMALQAVGRLHVEQVVHLRFELIRPRAKFELVGQVTWADAKGQAGVRFTDVSRNVRRSLKEWILIDLLTAAVALQAARPVLAAGGTEDGLVMSSLRVQPIQLPAVESHLLGPRPRVGAESNDADRVNVPWWPTGIRKPILARFVDTLVVLSAVLLFTITVTELTDIVPSSLMLVGSTLVLAVVFGLLYTGLCRFFLRTTLGRRLAELAAADAADDLSSTACNPYS